MIPNGTQYHPYYLEGYNRVGDELLILEVKPIYLDHEWKFNSHEIHIISPVLDQTSLFGSYGLPRYINESTPIFLCEEVELKGELSFFEGDFYEESEVVFTLPYTSIEYKKLKN